MTVEEARMASLDGVELQRGVHAPSSGFCVMEAVAYVAGETWSDHPRCASPVLTTFMTAWNDALSDRERQRLKPYVSKLVGSRASAHVEAARAAMACDWLTRTFAVTWLLEAGLGNPAAELQGLDEIASSDVLNAALPTVESARRAASTAWAEARNTRWDDTTARFNCAYDDSYGRVYGVAYDANLDGWGEDGHQLVHWTRHWIARDAAMAAVRDAALAAGMVAGRGAAYGAALGWTFDSLLGRAVEEALDVVRVAGDGPLSSNDVEAIRGIVLSAGGNARPDLTYVSVLGAVYDTALDAVFAAAYRPSYGAALAVAESDDPRAARAAALGAARGSLGQAVARLQRTAFDLLDRMLDVGAELDRT